MISGKDNPKQGLCPICRNKEIDTILEIDQVPIHCNLLYASRNKALQAPRGDIRLGFCRYCGHVFNKAFKTELMDYTQYYENSLYFSPLFQNYTESLASDLVDRYDLHGKDIIEIGSGKGDFLKVICKLGDNRGVGFDPTYVPKQSDNGKEKGQIKFVHQFYSESSALYKADFICCRHVLEHIQYPFDFLNTVRRSIGKRLNMVVFFEVPNVMFTIRDLGIWDLIYEHCSFFSKSSLYFLFKSCGFKIYDIKETYKGQYLCIEALPVKNLQISKHYFYGELKDLSSHIKIFANKYIDKIKVWRYNLKQVIQRKQKVVVWGAGSKGVTFLNILNTQKKIEYVVDINPRKQEKYIAGTGQQIVQPEFLRNYRPDMIIVMNPIYQDEIRQITEKLGLNDLHFVCT